MEKFSLIVLCMCVCVFINSGVKTTHQAAVVSKIDSRLEQYTSAIEVRDVPRVMAKQKRIMQMIIETRRTVIKSRNHISIRTLMMLSYTLT